MLARVCWAPGQFAAWRCLPADRSGGHVCDGRTYHHGMRRLVAALAGVFAVGSMPLVGSSEAAAADGEGHVTRYKVDLQVRRDGVLDVQERITYAFAST